MSILEVSGLKKTYGSETVFDNISFLVAQKDKIGIVGNNGCGKSTLLRAVAGLISLDAGHVKLANGYSLGYLAQDVIYDKGLTLYEETLTACKEVFLIRDKMALIEKRMAEESIKNDEASLTRCLKEYDLLQEEYNRKGGYNFDYQVKTVLFGLGFVESDLTLIVDNFSGGQKVRVTLAKLLIENPDILLLDEPTNHLDTLAIEWLEDYLINFHGSFIVVSHDRYFLDSVTERTFHVEDHVLSAYEGNYTYFQKVYEFNKQRQLTQYERQQELIGKYEEYIRKYKAGNRSTMAQSREKMLARIERIQRPRESSSLKLNIESAVRSGRKTLIIDNLSKSFKDKVLFKDLDLVVERGERIGIVGPNGSGKSTFLKIIAEEMRPDWGKVVYGENVQIGTFSQNLGELNDELSVLDEVYRSKGWTQVEARNYLARFLFKGETVFKKVKVLSGGERNRLILAKLFLASPNVILLDEPTNHLDIGAREALEMALSSYDGTVIVASHDRYFLDQIATSVLEIDKGKATLYQGNYSYFKERKKLEAELEKNRRENEDNGRLNTKASTKIETLGFGQNKGNLRSERQMKAKLDIELKSIEEEIKACETRQSELEEIMQDPKLYIDVEASAKVVKEHEETIDRLAKLYERWADLLEEREALM